MKKHLPTILIVLVFVVGLLVMFYPAISNWYNEQFNSYVVSNYDSTVKDKTKDEHAKILADAKEYNKKLHQLPENYTIGIAKDQNYIDTLNVLNGIMGHIVIDKIDVNIAIYHGTDENVLQKAVGHLEGSSLPTGQIGNHTVMTGHTGLPSAKLFTDLNKLVVGDTFEIYVLDEIYTYKIFDILVVEPNQIDDLKRNPEKDIVTLITCTPYGVNSHRLLVQGERIEVKN